MKTLSHIVGTTMRATPTAVCILIFFISWIGSVNLMIANSDIVGVQYQPTLPVMAFFIFGTLAGFMSITIGGYPLAPVLLLVGTLMALWPILHLAKIAQTKVSKTKFVLAASLIGIANVLFFLACVKAISLWHAHTALIKAFVQYPDETLAVLWTSAWINFYRLCIEYLAQFPQFR